MKKSVYVRFSLAFLLMFSMLSPVAVLAISDGKKHFREGIKAEEAEQWDKAVEHFALAIAEKPKNPEYRLHYTRALFNASQMYMKRGTAQANEKDYEGAYNAFRRAYAYDPTNELAKSEMARMLRLQEAVLKGEDPEKKEKNDKNSPNADVKLVKTSLGTAPPDVQVPQRLEKLRDLPFPSGVDLQFIIRELAKDLDLNVLFDTESFRQTGQPRKVFIELKNVTAAKALDYIFLQEGLFFQKVGPRTILVANQQRRQNFQQLVLRTFYLANAAPKDVAKVVQTAIPAQPGRTPTIVLTDDATNSVTIRDTEENVRLIGRLITSLDKDRAEVVMDVAIYEVNKSDLLEFGNQLGTGGDKGTLRNLGGVNLPYVTGGTTQNITSGLPFKAADAASIALGLPVSSISALQSKSNTKLLASTQIHAFNNEDSSARIGQRVPVRTASFAPVTGGGNNNNNNFFGDVINYEQVGLTLKFKPLVFPNQDVQVAMEIESKDVAGALSDTPVFTERTIKGTARVQNNKTLLLASVAQDIESNSRTGLPLLGLIPILGRLFTAPSKDNRKVDIVIAVTPRVIRAPAILPEDEEERPTGSLATPTNGSLEAMIIQEDREELLAAARRLPTATAVQLPDQKVEDAPVYVKSGETQNAAPNAETNAANDGENGQTAKSELNLSSLKPIDASAKTLNLAPTSEIINAALPTPEKTLKTPDAAENETPKSAAPTAEIKLLPNLPEMKRGEKTKIAVMVKSATAFRSAVLGLKFDAQKLAVRSVSFGDAFGADLLNQASTPFLNQGGKMYVSLSSPKDSAQNASGVLAYIEVEALADGAQQIAFDGDVMNLLTADGKNFVLKF